MASATIDATTYQFTDLEPEVRNKFRRHIKQHGLLRRPLGIKEKNQIIIFEGCHRTQLAIELGLDINADLRDISRAEALALKITLFQSEQRDYTPFEILRLVTFSEGLLSLEELAQRLETSPKKLTDYQSLIRLPVNSQQLLIQKSSLFKILPLVADSPESFQEIIFRLIETFHLNTNQALEMVNLINELQIAIPDFSLTELLSFEPSSSQRAEDFIQHLRHLRHPQYEKLRASLKKTLQSLNEPNLLVQYPDHFENQSIQLNTQLKSMTDLKNLLLLIRQKEPFFKRLFDLISEGMDHDY